MKNILITGAAGFIGSNFAEFMVNKYPNYNLIIVDKLTYAGNMNNLNKIIDKIKFIKEDICNLDEMIEIIKTNEIDAVVHFAAESHVDNSIKNPFIFTRNKYIRNTYFARSK